MKQFLFLILPCFLISCTSQAQRLEIILDDHELIINNHVGNEWGFGLERNDSIYGPQEPMYTSVNGKCKLRVYVQEIDKYTEEVTQWFEIDPTKLESDKIYTKEIEFIIQENMGRYAGNTAKWVLTLKYRKIGERA